MEADERKEQSSRGADQSPGSEKLSPPSPAQSSLEPVLISADPWQIWTHSQILDVLCKLPIGDIPWPLITSDQIFRAMSGEIVEPTQEQRVRANRALHKSEILPQATSRKPLGRTFRAPLRRAI